MRKILMLIAILATQQVFADVSGMMGDEDKPCMTIAKACLSAGFVETRSTDKGIWHDCMKPIILGKTVSGVTVDPAVVKTCRAHKIEKMKMELKELEKVK